jgi:hypothetical protein
MNSNQVTGWDLIQLTLIDQLRTGLFFNSADNLLSAIKTPHEENFLLGKQFIRNQIKSLWNKI